MSLKIHLLVLSILFFIACKKESETSIELKETFEFLNKEMSKENIEEYRKTPEDDIIGTYHMGLGRYIRNELGLWGGSDLKLFFENNGVSHPDEQSSVILIAYHRYLNNIEIKEQELLHPTPTKEQIAYRNKYYKSLKKYNKWLAKWDLKIMQPFYTTDDDNVLYSCDSTPVILKKYDNIQEYIKWSGRVDYTKEKFEELANTKKLKKYNYIDYQTALWDDGKIHVFKTSSKMKFKKVNDTLYIEAEFYSIPSDSIKKLQSKHQHIIIEKNIYKKYIPLFSKSFFTQDKYEYTDSKQEKGFKLLLHYFWETDNGKFYTVYLKPGENEVYTSGGSYTFDENLNIIYNNCQVVIDNMLTWSTSKRELYH